MKIMGINQGYSNNNLSSQTTFTGSINNEIKNNIRKAMNNRTDYDYKKIINPLIKKKPTKLQHTRKLAELKKAFDTTPTERNSYTRTINTEHISNLKNDNTSLSEAIKNNVARMLHEQQDIDYQKLIKPLIKRKPTKLQHARKVAELKKVFSLKNDDSNKVLDMQPMPKAKKILTNTENELNATAINSEDFLAKVINPLVQEEPSELEHKIREKQLNQVFSIKNTKNKYVMDMLPTDEAREIVESTDYKLNKFQDVNYKDIIESKFAKKSYNNYETQKEYNNLFKKNAINSIFDKFYEVKNKAFHYKNNLMDKYDIRQKATKTKTLLQETMSKSLEIIKTSIIIPYNNIIELGQIWEVKETQRQNMKNFFSHKYSKR